MKTDITLLSSPQIFYSRFPFGGRILYQNLSNNKNFKVHLSESIQLKCYTEGFQRWKGLWDENESLLSGKNSYDVFARGWLNIKYGKFNWNCRFPLFYMYTGALDNLILENIETEIVFCTAYSIIDLRIIKTLLNDKRKIVLGGAATMIYSYEEIRKYLVEMGVDKNIVDKNIIIVSGYVDLTTDLYKIFEKWEDTKIEENDFTTFWDCTEDGFMDYVQIYRKIFDTNLTSIMTSKCWWGKCKYCTYTCLPKIDFSKNVSIDKMLDYYHTLEKNYDSSNVFFNDSYFLNTKYNTELINAMTNEGFSVSFFSGVKLMSNRKYLKFINNSNVNVICMGLESVNDFSLDYIIKGYYRKDITYMLSQIKKYIDRPLTLFMLLMIDLPMNSKNKKQYILDVNDDWNYLAEMKRKLIDMGLHVQMAFSPLRHFPKTNLIDNNLLRYAEDGMGYEELSGLNCIYDYFSRHLGINIDSIKENRCINEPVARFLPNGEFIESDMHHVDKHILKYVSTWE
jgi:hypothetical protein